jgi:hypothetical protein
MRRAEGEALHAFIDALREVLGLEPLHSRRERTMLERFGEERTVPAEWSRPGFRF